MKVAIKLRTIYWDKEGGHAELQIVDPEVQGDDIYLKLEINSMSVIDIKKEWFEVENA